MTSFITSLITNYFHSSNSLSSLESIDTHRSRVDKLVHLEEDEGHSKSIPVDKIEESSRKKRPLSTSRLQNTGEQTVDFCQKNDSIAKLVGIKRHCTVESLYVKRKRKRNTFSSMAEGTTHLSSNNPPYAEPPYLTLRIWHRICPPYLALRIRSKNSVYCAIYGGSYTELKWISVYGAVYGAIFGVNIAPYTASYYTEFKKISVYDAV